MAGVHNFSANKGATFSKSVTYNDSNGDPIDLTGFTATMLILDEWDGDTVQTLSIGSGLTIGNPSDGTINIKITDEETGALDVDIYVYKLDIESASGDVTRILDGDFIMNN